MGKRFRRVEQAAEQCMKRRFVKKENVDKRQTLEIQTAQRFETPLGPRPGGGRKRSRVEAGVAAAAATINRSVKKVKAPAETCRWPSFQLRRPVTIYSA